MPSRARSVLASTIVAVCVLVVGVMPAAATEVAQPLPFTKDWSNLEEITLPDDWSGVPGVVGFLGQGLTNANDVDPQTVLGQSAVEPDVDVLANQANPDGQGTGGVGEFHIGDPVVALQGSSTADAPYILITLNTAGCTGIKVAYNLRDIDGSSDNAVQQVALQFRVGKTGAFTNVPAGYVPDATTGPDLAELVTPVSAALPAAADDKPAVQARVITTNASSFDEWVGVDDISITGTCGDAAPAVKETTPADGAAGVPVDSGVSITFTEDVTVTDDAFGISCSTSGDHDATVTDASPTFTLDPTDDFVQDETCTVTVFASEVTDQDGTPPDTMAANFVFSFSTETSASRIHDIQGASHTSPKNGLFVHDVPGIVIARGTNGFWFQDPSPDADDETSEGLFVFTGGPPAVAVGDLVHVAGTVVEFRPGGATTANLTTTELSNPNRSIVVVSSGNALPATTTIGVGGRLSPTQLIDDDATGSVETSGSFDAATDGIDFYESLEGMRIQLNDVIAVGPTNGFGEIPVVTDNGGNASVRTPRGGVLARPTDFNPERVQLDDTLIGQAAMPLVDVGDYLGTVFGVLDYSFANFKLFLTDAPESTPGGFERETGAAAKAGQLTVATFNVENLDPTDPAAKFEELAGLIVDNLASPDLVSLEEVQDDNGATNNGVVGADATYAKLIAAIEEAGGPTYDFRQINPVNNADGGEPGGNIRVGFLFRTDRGLAFVDRAGGTSTDGTTVLPGPELSFSPGRIDPGNSAFEASRKPLAGEFTYLGETLFVVANHFNSKGGDDPLFGRFQPPTRVTETQRHKQAQVVNDFVDALLAEDADANVIVLGDLNDFDFSDTLTILRGGVLTNLYTLLPQAQRYSYDFEGNSQALDHVLVSSGLEDEQATLDVVHVNAEFAAQASDHDPLLSGFCLDGTAPKLTVTATPNRLWPPNHTYVRVQVTPTVTDAADATPTISFVSATSSEPDNAPGSADGNTVDDVVKIDDDTFDLRAERNENGSGRTYTLAYRAVDDCGNATTASGTVRVPIGSTG